ncbi:hypothetical protein TNCV_4322381 [Trichonephila clavipes]|uniref:Uncharacterized protein n=1 Tax=Trichonephila clavipes TaxID=2585209 RepID=A0A8X6VKN3_TRICX|nr:hypothetical protein TNCV_4322381 [Trichonephila clavipes]
MATSCTVTGGSRLMATTAPYGSLHITVTVSEVGYDHLKEERYKDEVLEPYVRLFRRAMGDQFDLLTITPDHAELRLSTIIWKKWVFVI